MINQVDTFLARCSKCEMLQQQLCLRYLEVIWTMVHVITGTIDLAQPPFMPCVQVCCCNLPLALRQ